MSKNDLKVVRIEITSIDDRIAGELVARVYYRHEPTHNADSDLLVVEATRLDASEALIRRLLSETGPRADRRLGEDDAEPPHDPATFAWGFQGPLKQKDDDEDQD